MSMRLACGLLLVARFVFAAENDFLTKAWPAQWIEVPDTPSQDFGVYHFRRTFELASKPDRFVVYVSGDNRYQLFVNGQRVAWGPARSDLTHWRYETVDLAPNLHAGRNVLAAIVWNDGPYRAVAQVSNGTGFLLQAADPGHAAVDTNHSWKCTADAAYTPQVLPKGTVSGYYVAPPNERVDGHLYPWDWQEPSFDDAKWIGAKELTHAAPRDARDAPNRWMLVPSEIPLEEQKLERLASVREAQGIQADDKLLAGKSPLTVPPQTSVRLLLDQSFLTTAYPELQISGGADARVELHYAEALYSKAAEPKKFEKLNRNEVAGKQFFGPFDTFHPDGGAHRVYRPLFWRTYRYLELDVKTANDSLTVEDLRGVFSAYPFTRRADFQAGDKPTNDELQTILSTGWRTARLCAHETYMDCPFYEQLQYAGDARIQMLVSLYMTGDARLMKNGIALLNSSRTAEGITYSRAPSNLQQYIPPFSLWWIGMVHDYWMFVDDPKFVKEMMPGVHAVLEFYARYQKPGGSLQRMPWWNFVDWVKEWPNGEPPGEPDGSSTAPLDLQLLLAYRWAADLEKVFGSRARAAEYESAAAAVQAKVLASDWDERTGLFADQPSHRTYSQQTNTLAVLAHILPGRSGSIVEKMNAAGASPQLAQSSIYFRAYTNAALREAGLGNKYLESLGPWREMLAAGLTTWSEIGGPETRSDCHAWGASPNFELLRTVAGIDSAAPGFKRVRITPNPGQLEQITARMPHPKGLIQVRIARKKKLVADIDLPPDTTGELDWAGTQRELHPGKNHVEVQ